MNCSNYSENCNTQQCTVTSKITSNDINCKTKIVFINRNNDSAILTNLNVKKVDDDCYIFFTQKKQLLLYLSTIYAKHSIMVETPNGFRR